MVAANAGLTTTKAPFIEQARAEGSIYIRQPYELYSAENQEAWRQLYARLLPRWRKYANRRFLQGVEQLALDPHNIPRLEDVNRFLQPLSGFAARAVSGYVPAYVFFDCLRQRAFPTTITIRDVNTLDYLPEPDIFHDVAGHVPMHTDRGFADVLVRFGEAARAAARLAREIGDERLRVRRVESMIKAMARFFWFTIEFGLMRDRSGAGEMAEAAGSREAREGEANEDNGRERGGADNPAARGLRVYGSGLLSSYGEIAHCLESPDVQRWPFQLEWVINQYFEIDHYQPLLFIVESFEHLFEQVDVLERWMREGKLDNVAPGEPEVNEADLKSFLEAEV